VTTDVKSRAGRRTVSASPPAIEQHREQQAAERIRVGDLWRDEGWVFTNRLGGPVHPTVDYDAWKSLLDKEGTNGAVTRRTAHSHDDAAGTEGASARCHGDYGLVRRVDR
jgi:integrase